MNRFLVSFDGSNDINTALENVISHIKENSGNRIPRLIVFSSAAEGFSHVASRLHETFPDAFSIGMSSYMNFSSEGYSWDGVSAISVFEDIECQGGIIKDIRIFPKKYAKNLRIALDKLENRENTICLEFTTAFSNCEDLVQDTFREVLEEYGIPSVGGSAGCRKNQTESFVALNGDVYTEACVYALIHNVRGSIHIFKENMFRPTDHIYTPTEVDCDERRVIEFDHKPAVGAIAQTLNVSAAELKEIIRMHPIGRIEGEEILITDADEILPDGSISYFARIFNYSRLVQLEPEDIEMVWDLTARKVHSKVSRISFSIVVNCFSRTDLFVKEDRFDSFTDQLSKEYGEFMGVSGLGEQMNYEHLNQTMVLICFE